MLLIVLRHAWGSVNTRKLESCFLSHHLSVWVRVCRHGQIGLNISLDMVTAPFSPRGTDIALSKLSRMNGFLINVSSKI